MTVRVEKPAFNLRDKLTQLDKPVGVHGSQILKSETPQDTFKLVGAGRKNIIINGDMRIAQRSTNVTNISVTDTYYTADRWKLWIGSAGTFTNSITTVDDVRVPGFRQGFKYECTSAVGSLGSSSSMLFTQNVERHNTLHLKKGYPDAEYITVSFYVKSSITGKYVLEIYDNVNNRHCSKGYTINRPNVWEYKTITYPPDVTGRLHPASTTGLSFYWWLVAGTTYSGGELTETWQSAVANQRAGGGTANIGLTSGATWEITGIQAETGKVATEFEYLDYEAQLALCYRYYRRFSPYSPTGTDNYCGYGIGIINQNFGGIWTFPLDIPMRDRPSITQNNLRIYDGSTNANITAMNTNRSSQTSIWVEPATSSSSFTSGRAFLIGGNNTAGGYVELDAEL